jgi:hypothetical protein
MRTMWSKQNAKSELLAVWYLVGQDLYLNDQATVGSILCASLANLRRQRLFHVRETNNERGALP